MAADHYFTLNSPPTNHRNYLTLCMLRQIFNSIKATIATRNYYGSSDAFEFLTMLYRCNFYKIADFNFAFCRKRPQCQTIDFLTHLHRTISG